MRRLSVVVAMLIGAALISSQTGAAPADEKQDDGPGARSSKIPAIEVWVDLGLGLCDDQEAKKRLKAANIEDLKTGLEAEMKGMKEDFFGVRHVTTEEFVAMMKQFETVSSFISSNVIGTTRDRAYVEVKVHLTGEHGYVAIVTTEVAGLPAEMMEKFER